MPGQRKWCHDDSEDDNLASITLIETDEDEGVFIDSARLDFVPYC